MKPLFIGSVSLFSGKSTVCLGLAKNFINKGLKVGYFKPIGVSLIHYEGKLVSEDAVFFKKVLKLEDPIDEISPISLTRLMIEEAYRGRVENLKDKILNAFHKIAKGKDIILTTGMGLLYSGSFLGVSELNIMKELDAPVIMIDKFRLYETITVDNFLGCKDLLKDKLIGVIFNKVPKNAESRFHERIVPFLTNHSIDTFGIIPVDPILGAVTVNDLKKALNGRFICHEDKGELLVERYCIGAMNVEAALRHFRQVNNKAVITGGDRSDIQLAALETSTRCLILTGSLEPSYLIVDQAEQKGVPIITVPGDTAQVVDTVDNLLGHLSLHNENKVDRVVEIFNERVDIKKIFNKIGC